MILRVLWPFSTAKDYLPDLSGPALLLGALLNSSERSEEVVTAAIVALCPLTLLQSVPDGVLEQLPQVQVHLPTQHAAASLAVLGIWQADCSPTARYTACKVQSDFQSNGVWLALHSTLGVQQTFSGSRQQLWAPACHLQQCELPNGADCIQFCLYAVPAQQPGFGHVQLPLPAHGPQLPWMTQHPGTVSMSALMHMLQQAHAAMHLQQPQQPHLLKPLQVQQQQQQQLLQQKKIEPKGRRNQQQQQHQQIEQQRLIADTAPALQQGWAQLAAMLGGGRTPGSAFQQQLSRLSSHLTNTLQAAAHIWPVPAAAPTQQSACCTSAASQHQASQGPDSSRNVLSPPGNQTGVLQLVVQHLLGLLIAINLWLHRQVVLDAAAAAGTWLQRDVLQPHVQWLMEAHPGGIKLHLELSLLLGTAARTCLQLAATWYSQSWTWLGPVALTALAAAAAVGGASWGCAAAADILFVLLWPLVGLYVLCAALHRLQLRCLAATWRLIRGKQKVRRFSTHHRAQHEDPQQQQQTHTSSATPSGSRTTPAPAQASGAAAVQDSTEPGDEVSVEQLIVGVLLFTPLLGLLPTTATWYLSVCWLYSMLHALRLLLLVAGSWMQLRPLHVCAARWSRPQLFPGQLMVLPLRCVAQDPATSAAAVGSSRSSAQARAVRENQDAVNSVRLAYYHAFYEPLGYWDVLTQSIAQQQGLLWYACLGSVGDSAAEVDTDTGGAARLIRWGKDVVAGRAWGLRMLSARWQFL